MDHLSKQSQSRYFWRQIDAVDATVSIGFGCVIVGMALRYDAALALIAFGTGLLIVGALATWRRG